MDQTTIRFPQAGSDSTTISLSREQGENLQRVIEKESGIRFSAYLITVGMDRANVLAILAGRKKLSVKTLTRLMSGLENWSVECRTEFVMQKISGEDATSASSQSLEDLLFSEEMGMSDQGP